MEPVKINISSNTSQLNKNNVNLKSGILFLESKMFPSCKNYKLE